MKKHQKIMIIMPEALKKPSEKTTISMLDSEIDKMGQLLRNSMDKPLNDIQIREINSNNVRLFSIYHVISEKIDVENKERLEVQLKTINGAIEKIVETLGNDYVPRKIDLSELKLDPLRLSYSMAETAEELQLVFTRRDLKFDFEPLKSYGVDSSEFLAKLVNFKHVEYIMKNKDRLDSIIGPIIIEKRADSESKPV